MNTQKTVLITGCSSGIGFLTALSLARARYRVFATLRNIDCEGALKLKALALEENLSIEIVEIDINQHESILEGMRKIQETTKTIDILINNAGFGYLGPVEEFSEDEIKEQFETNVFGTFRMMKTLLPLMRSQKQGRIINVSSIAGLIPFPLYGIYASSKFALEAMSEALAFEVRPFGIKVVLVEPGSFSTNFVRNKKIPHSATKETSPYFKLTKFLLSKSKTRTKLVKVLTKAANSQKVADKILEICKMENPRMRYLLGYDAHIYYVLKKFLPQKIWSWILSKNYRY